MRTLLAIVVAALAGCAADAPAPAESDAATPTHVQLANSQFVPDVLRVARGTTVTWTNHDEMTHTVTPTDAAAWGTEGSGDDPALWMPKDATWSHTFAAPGTFEYYCIPHAVQDDTGRWIGMVARVLVG